jgi:hypothetical protein
MQISVNEGFDIIGLEVNFKVAMQIGELARPGFGYPVLAITYS